MHDNLEFDWACPTREKTCMLAYIPSHLIDNYFCQNKADPLPSYPSPILGGSSVWMALNLIWDLSVIWLNSLVGLHSGKPANLCQWCIALCQYYTENEKSNEISILCIQTGPECLNGPQTLGMNRSRPRRRQSEWTVTTAPKHRERGLQWCR